MSEINDRVKITKNVTDAVLSRPSFSTCAIIAKHGNTGVAAIETYSGLEGVLANHAVYSPVGVAASLFFSQKWVPDSLKIIYRGDAESVADAMATALALDSDFYFIGTTDRDNASINAVSDWAQANGRLDLFSTEDDTTPTATETDPAFYAQDLSMNMVASYFKKDAGRDIVISDITVTSTTATATSTAHGVEVGEYVYIWETTSTGSRGKQLVLTAPTADTFTFAVAAGTANDAAGGIKCLVSGQMLEFGLIGLMASTEPGRRTFDLQTIAGISADKLTDSEKGFLGGKDCNYYVSFGGTPVTSGLKTNGFGGKVSTGRNIDLQWFLDWFVANAQIDIAEVLINASGELAFDADGLQKTQAALEQRCQTSFNNKAVTTFEDGPYIGLPYKVVMPKLAEITTTDRTNGLLTGIKIYMFYRNKIKGVEIELNLSI